MYFLSTETAVASVHAFWIEAVTDMPPNVKVQVENFGDVIESTTGALTGGWSNTPQAVLTGSGDANYAAPTGLLVRWDTNTILDSHRLRGRTFVVPTSRTTFGGDGTIFDTTRDLITAAAGNLVIAEAGKMVIWHRPFAGRPAAPPKPAKPSHLGGHGVVTSGACVDKAAILRSRRD